VSVIEARGLYHPAFDGIRAWIEIFVNNTLRGWENDWWLRVPLLREGKIGDVLFHEIGHQIHFSSRPQYREREDVADVWKVRLQKQYTKKRFRWTAGLGRLIRPLLGPFMDQQRAKVETRLLRMGQISRVEYEESMRSSLTKHHFRSELASDRPPGSYPKTGVMSGLPTILPGLQFKVEPVATSPSASGCRPKVLMRRQIGGHWPTPKEHQPFCEGMT
jgi:hypothetical protein